MCAAWPLEDPVLKVGFQDLGFRMLSSLLVKPLKMRRGWQGIILPYLSYGFSGQSSGFSSEGAFDEAVLEERFLPQGLSLAALRQSRPITMCPQAPSLQQMGTSPEFGRARQRS